MNDLILYTTEDGRSQIKLRAKDETVWLTQREMSQLFDVSTDNVGLHLKNIFADGELEENSVTEESSVTAADGKNYLFDIKKEKAPGGIIKTITKEALSDFTVKYPKIAEQQRIASCLTSLDDLIAAQTQKLEALKTHKKGLMQQLFPAPTEQPHTREGQRPGLFPSPEEVAG